MRRGCYEAKSQTWIRHLGIQCARVKEPLRKMIKSWNTKKHKNIYNLTKILVEIPFHDKYII